MDYLSTIGNITHLSILRGFEQNNMSNGPTIVNDPIYGLIEIPSGLICELVDHPYFQRLRRIQQLGVTHYVYPGATHSRFHHSMGALYLMRKALHSLQSKGIAITAQEIEGASIAILLHDIGHGPFSHSLEHQLIDVHHEHLSQLLMEQLNEQFNGRLTLALQIFNNQYHKQFLHQLVSGQFDMDRMDYLTRDSFFTGVQEGKVGYNRLLKLLNVHEDQLVVEFKGIYSVENFLIARRLMYWQVYLHKNVICSGEMLVQLMRRARNLLAKGEELDLPSALHYFLSQHITKEHLVFRKNEVLNNFYKLDDADLLVAIKELAGHKDPILSYLGMGLLERKLLKIELGDHPTTHTILTEAKEKLRKKYPNLSEEDYTYLVFEGKEANHAYKRGREEILILLKNGTARPISEWQEHCIQSKEVVKYFVCYPKM